jgi:hypothetical protein
MFTILKPVLTGIFVKNMTGVNIHDELIKLEQDQEPAKETLKYRVGFYFYNDDAKHLFLVTNQEHADLEEKNPGFVRWVADWIEVEV